MRVCLDTVKLPVELSILIEVRCGSVKLDCPIKLRLF